MKIFWSWQSDLQGNISRHFIKECITEAIEELKEEAVFDDRVEIDHDTKDVLGSPAITTTIFEKIKNATVFIADITPVATTVDEKGNVMKKIMNPNVAIEMGFATALLGDSKIITVMNGSFGTLDDLPFDLKHKRGAIFYNLKDASDKGLVASEKRKLIDNLKNALKGYIVNPVSNTPSLNLDLNGKAIFFDPDKPLLKLQDDFSFGPKVNDYFFHKPNSYIYVKVVPSKKLNLSKLEVKKLMMTSSGNLTIAPLYNLPSQGPEVNKYGSITTSFDPSGNKTILSFVQLFQDGSIIAIPGMLIGNSRNALYLLEFRQRLHKFLVDAFLLLKAGSQDENLEVQVEIGLVNNDAINIVLPNLNNGNSYINNHKGPLENENYYTVKKLKLSETERINEILKEFIASLMDDIGLGTTYDDHRW